MAWSSHILLAKFSEEDVSAKPAWLTRGLNGTLAGIDPEKGVPQHLAVLSAIRPSGSFQIARDSPTGNPDIPVAGFIAFE
jgi:hypothetical protein